MSGRAWAAALGLLLVAGLAGCRQAEEPATHAPVHVEGEVVLEPATLQIGELAALDVTVVTPPDHVVDPIEPPASVPGLWILEVRELPLREDASRWIHVTRFHVRSRETGSFEWPVLRVGVSDPAGLREEIEIAGRPFEVAASAPQLTEGTRPFSFRGGEAPGDSRGFWTGVGVGSLLSGLAFGAVALLRRRRSASSAEAPTDARPLYQAAWRTAQAALQTALARADEDPLVAADQTSAALRHYIERRYDVAATAATTEELAILEPPFALSSRWPELVQMLRRLDAIRFRALATEAPEAIGELRSVIREALRFADESPPGERAS